MTAVQLPMALKASATWLGKRHDCTPEGIAARCGGRCCVSGPSGTRWPPSSGGPGPNVPCPMLGPTGCTFTPEDRPVTCLLYPLRVNDHGTVILHHRTAAPTSCCAGNHGQGPPVLEALRGQLTTLFGSEQYDRLVADVAAGHDGWLELTDDLRAAMAAEEADEAANRVPVARTRRVVA